MISSELRDKLLEVIDSSLTIEQLEDWLAPRLHKYLTEPDSTDAQVAVAIEHGLAQMRDSILTENEFLNLLRNEVQKHQSIQFTYPATKTSFTETSSSNQTLKTSNDLMAIVPDPL